MGRRANLAGTLKSSSNPQVAAEAREQLASWPTSRNTASHAASSSSSKFSPSRVLHLMCSIRTPPNAPRRSRPRTILGTADMRPTKFFEGRLVDVDCSQSPAAFLPSLPEAVLKLRTADYKSLLLIGADTFSCAWNIVRSR